MKEIGSYPKIYNLGHKAVRDIFNEQVVVQEKIDGSQFSFMKKDGVTYARSKGAMLYFDNPEKMFSKGLESVKNIEGDLTDGWIYRGEYLQKPKHNVLKYDRVPEGHIILYDVEINPQEFMDNDRLKDEAMFLGLESVRTWYLENPDQATIAEIMLQTSALGGVAYEGLVFKNYNRFDPFTGKVMMAKHVSEAFKEVHRSKKYRTSNKDIIESLKENYRTEARWQKAYQVLRDNGHITDSPKDIGNLIKEVNQDVLDECKEEIMEILFKWGWKQISRGLTAGLPEWYKNKLVEKQFEEGEDAD
jgi:hypothetical protein